MATGVRVISGASLFLSNAVRIIVQIPLLHSRILLEADLKTLIVQVCSYVEQGLQEARAHQDADSHFDLNFHL